MWTSRGWPSLVNWAKGSITDRGELLGIAGIHTSIITILVAGVFAYLGFTNTAVQQAELKTMEEAEKINDLRFAVHHSPHRLLAKGEVFETDNLIRIMSDVLTCQDSPSLPKDLVGRGEKALGIMGALTEQYPFPVRTFRTSEGRLAVRGNPDALQFGDLNEVRTWVRAMEKTTDVFRPELTYGGKTCLLSLLDEFGRSSAVVRQKKIHLDSPLTRLIKDESGSLVLLKALEPVDVYEDFVINIRQARKVMMSTKNRVRQADAVQQRYPSKRSLSLGFVLIALAFGTGVLYPMCGHNVMRLLAVWVPLCLYSVTFAWLAWRILL